MSKKKDVLGEVVQLIVKLTGEMLVVLYDLLVKLTSDVKGTETFAALKLMLRKDNPWPKIHEWPIWNILRVNAVLKTADDFRKALKNAGIQISKWANDILGKLTAMAEAGEYELVVVSGNDLGFEKAVSREDIYKRASEHGLETCPPEFGPLAILQFGCHLKPGEWILVAMEPIVDSGGGLRVFHLERHDDGVLWLTAHYVSPGILWAPGYRWLFVRRKR